ncbi:MAG: hypothetical protein ACP5IL_13275, partial [Syntrophobacteraceae bacterium]
MSASKILIDLPAKGKYRFTPAGAKKLLGASDAAVHSTVQRLRKKGEMASCHADSDGVPEMPSYSVRVARRSLQSKA